MIDWNLVTEIAGGGFGVTMLVLIILALAAWVMSFVIQRTRAKGEEAPAKSEKTEAKEG